MVGISLHCQYLERNTNARSSRPNRDPSSLSQLDSAIPVTPQPPDTGFARGRFFTSKNRPHCHRNSTTVHRRSSRREWWVPGRIERGDEDETDRSRSMSARPKLPFFEWVHATRPGTRALLRRGLATAERGRSIIFRLKRGRRATSQIR